MEVKQRRLVTGAVHVYVFLCRLWVLFLLTWRVSSSLLHADVCVCDERPLAVMCTGLILRPSSASLDKLIFWLSHLVELKAHASTITTCASVWASLPGQGNLLTQCFCTDVCRKYVVNGSRCVFNPVPFHRGPASLPSAQPETVTQHENGY